MTRGRRLTTTIFLAATATAAAALASGAAAAPPPSFTPIGTYATGLGETSGETVAYSKNRMYVTNTVNNSLDIVDVSVPTAPSRIRRVDLSAWGAGPNSVDVKDGLVAIAVEAAPKTAPGAVVFLDRDGDHIAHVAVGALPDMLAFTPQRDYLVVANEGEPNSYAQADSVDPEGTVSIIDVADHDGRGWKPNVRTVGFAAFNAGGARASELPAAVRLNGPGASVAQDLEPEYVAFAKDGGTGYVTLQENNAVAVVDLQRARIIKIRPLGTKDHNVAGFGLDASDRDGVISIRPWPVRGMFMPDAIARFSVRGDSYLITGNEGDGRDYTGFTDEAPVSALTLAIPGADILQLRTNLGRLTVSNTDGLDAAGSYEALYAFGARSATIWNASTGVRVWDSGDMFEQVTAAAAPLAFNVSNSNNTFDNRSDNKGPEPEGVTTGTIRGRTYAFVGLERIGGFIVLDVTNPTAPTFVQWANNRVYTGPAVGPDSGPEIVRFVTADESPNDRPTVIVANEVSGTVTLYETK